MPIMSTIAAVALALLVPPALPATATPAAGAGADSDGFSPALYQALRGADLRLATIAHRLTTSNAALCSELQPALGIQFHALAQYRQAARPSVTAAFGFATPVAVEAVVAGSPAALAGVQADDGLVAIDGVAVPAALPDRNAPAATTMRDDVDRRIAALPPDRSIGLTLRRGGQTIEVTVNAGPGCRARFEVHAQDEAAADGSIVQVGATFLDRYDDNALTVVVAHELSHIILRHNARLGAAGVNYGILAELGKSARLHAQAENEADLLSVYLLANAGYDPLIAGRFWRGPGRKLDPGLLRSRAYLGWKARAAALDAEAAKIPAGVALPFVPPLVALRDAAMK